MTRSVYHLAAMVIACCLGGCGAVRGPAPPIAPAIAGTPALAIITWNMHHGRGKLSQLVADLKAGRIVSTSVDYVLLLQEATTGGEPDTLAQAASLGLTTYFDPVRRRSGLQTGNAIISTLPLGTSRVIALPRERQPRSAVVASVGVAGTELFVVSVHLENRVGWTRGLLFSDGARGRQAEALIDALPAGAHGIVGGDMNTWLGPGEPAWRTLLERFPDTPPDPQPTLRDRLVLDHLFFDLPEGWTATRQVIADQYGSDHHPVLGLLYASAK